MPRDRHKKYPKKPAEVSLQPSSAAQALINRITLGGWAELKNDMDLFERILISSSDLAEEPEFADLTLSSENAAEVTEKWLDRYEQQLTEAQKKGEDEFQQAYDDARIKIIEELATPGFRGVIKRQLQAFTERCIADNDLPKLELALYLGPVLQTKEIPWGVIGLIDAIYARTLDEVLEPTREQQAIFETMTKAIEDAGEDPAVLEKMLESPDQYQELVKKLSENNPEFQEQLEKVAWSVVEEFEHQLFIGNIDLHLFSEEEIDQADKRFEEELGEELSAEEPGPETTKRLFENIHQALDEIMTPERYQRFRKDVEAVVEAWKQANNQWAGPLILEQETLSEEYELTGFILTAFAGQVFRGVAEEKPAQKQKKRKGH